MLSVWDGVQGRTWFSINHLPEMPRVPHGADAVRLLMSKLARNAPDLVLQLARGPRTLFLGALAIAAAFVCHVRSGAAHLAASAVRLEKTTCRASA